MKPRSKRHYTDHGRPDKHSDPHDHETDWSNGYPKLGPPINYPDGAPEFKNFKEMKYILKVIGKNTPEDNRFKTISDFKWSVNGGGEVEFVYNNKVFGIFPKVKQTSDSPMQILISQIYIKNPASTEMWCDKADEVLEYLVDGVRLRDIITEVEVTSRTI